MDSADSTPTSPPSSPENLAAKAVSKRYEGLVMVRTKAIKGKGAWYWVHFEPILVRNPNTNIPKAVKLKCSLCNAVFSASNPSRTATEHLKRGTCRSFNPILGPNSSVSPLPLSTLPPLSSPNHRKRGSLMGTSPSAPPSLPSTSLEVHSLAMVESSRYSDELGFSPGQNPIGTSNNCGLYQNHLMLSGGKKDMGPLIIFENSVKKLKSPKASYGPALSKQQIDSAFELLAQWFYESCGSVSLTSLEQPKFRAFLNRVGLPAVSMRELLGVRLDAKFDEAKAKSEARIRDAMFFQVASSGWKSRSFSGFPCGEDNMVKFTVNLPNQTSVFQKAVLIGSPVSSKYAEEILWDTITSTCGSTVQRCVGIIADKYKAKALRNFEIQNHWMVNISCQLQGFIVLIKDFNNEFSLFRVVTENCLKVANFINTETDIRNIIFQKYKIQELGCSGLLRVPSPKCDTSKNFTPVYAMLDDLLSCARTLQMVVLDDSCKATFGKNPVARAVAEIIQSKDFWNELEAVYSLVNLIIGMAQEIETERPLIGQCLPLWEELRTKIKHWGSKFCIGEGPVEKIVEKRFRKNYHPAWAAAFILDPLYLVKNTSGKYLPPFTLLTNEQEKDVDKLIIRLVNREEAHIALMELMKWRSEGLDPLYAQAVQVKQGDSVTGKMKIANPQSSRLVWETCLSEFKSLSKVAVRLIFLQATACGFKCNRSLMNWLCVHSHSRIGRERAQKMIYIAAHAKLDKRDYNEEEKDADLFTATGDDDYVLNEVFADTPSSVPALIDRVPNMWRQSRKVCLTNFGCSGEVELQS